MMKLYIGLLLYVTLVSGHNTKDITELDEITNLNIEKDTNRQKIGFSNNCSQAILACCSVKKSQKQCFTNFNCAHLYGNRAICGEKMISSPLEYSKDSFDRNNTGTKQIRVKRWHYVYNQQQTSRPQLQYQYPETNGYNFNQQYFPTIYGTLEETNVKKPQPQSPQHNVYVPYLVPYHVHVPQSFSVVDKVPDIISRGPAIDEKMESQNSNTNSDDGQDGARPISFIPIKPERTLKRLAPKVEHGSIQSNVISPGQTSSVNGQNTCMLAILACCQEDKTQEKNCFHSVGCGVIDSENACKSDMIKSALDAYKIALSQ